MKMQKDPLKTIHEIWPHLKPWQRKWLRIQGEVIYGFMIFINILYRMDLWLFPPLAFFSAYIITSKYFPPHPIKIFAVLSTAFMFSTLNLFLLRPRKWKRIVHWVKANE